MITAWLKLSGPAALAAAAIGLAGCNLVYSETPLFTAADDKAGPPLRTGLWLETDPACAVETSAPAPTWPKCADWYVVRPTQVIATDKDGKPQTFDYLLASGAPTVLQVPFAPGKDGKLLYFYQAFVPIRTDERGRVVEYRHWPAQCGQPPPDKPNQDPRKQRFLTRQLIEGLRASPDGQNCIALAQGPVRLSARLSEAWAEPKGGQVDRWIRDDER